MKLNFIDLFAGCGGLSEGFLQTGHFHALAHVEWEMPMVSTLRNRLHSKWNHSIEEAFKNVIHFDIQKTDINKTLSQNKDHSTKTYKLQQNDTGRVFKYRHHAHITHCYI
jgi:DNA (cytosine-5)-methyltransferase 1